MFPNVFVFLGLHTIDLFAACMTVGENLPSTLRVPCWHVRSRKNNFE